MTISMRRRMFSRAVICASLLMTSALAAASVSAQQGAPVADQQRSGEATRSLFDAVQANDLAAVQASIAAGADLTAKDQWGLTPVDLAIDKSYFDVAHFLLSLHNFQRAESARRGATPMAAAGFTNRAPSAAKGSVRARRPEAARTAPGVAMKQSPPRQENAKRETPRRPVERWPSNQPNPFDPDLPAPGAALPGDGPGEAIGGQGYTAAAERPQVQ